MLLLAARFPMMRLDMAPPYQAASLWSDSAEVGPDHGSGEGNLSASRSVHQPLARQIGHERLQLVVGHRRKLLNALHRRRLATVGGDRVEDPPLARCGLLVPLLEKQVVEFLQDIRA